MLFSHIFVRFHSSFSSANFSCLVNLLVCPLTWYGTTPSPGATCRTDPCKYFSFDKLFCAQGVSPGLRAGKSLYFCLDILLFCDSVLCLEIILFFYGRSQTRGQGDQDISILSRTVDILIQVILSRATAILFRLGCALCRRGLPWTTGWRINRVLSRMEVALCLVTLSRYFLFFNGVASTRDQGDQEGHHNHVQN